MKNIPHHLLDVSSPRQKFTVAQYQKLAIIAIKNILKKNKLPILCGGSGFYVQSVTDGIIIPEVKPDWKLRKKLEKKPTEYLFKTLKKLDPKRAKNIDRKNPRRLIRAIEIVKKTGSPVKPLKSQKPEYRILMLGIEKPKKELKELIEKRLKARFKSGMITEVKNLKKSGVSWKRLEEFGLEYRWISLHLQKKINYKEMTAGLQKDIEHFAKRQMTWFRRNKNIKWIKNSKEAKRIIKDFMKK